MKIKHSKFKNTGLIFELLVRKLTADTLSQKNSPALKIIKEFYAKTELSKEHKIYQSLINTKTNNGDKIYSIIDSVLNESKKLNRSTLRREKYNLIKEIKTHYNIDDFFKSNIPNYSTYASVYTLIEETNSPEFTNPDLVIRNKETLAEHIAKQSSVDKPKQDQLIEEYSEQHKDVRMIAYKILLEKFNRSEFIQRMAEKGIGCSVHFIPLHLHPFYRDKFGFERGAFPNAEWVYEREVSLPLYPKLSEEELWGIISAVRDILQS